MAANLATLLADEFAGNTLDLLRFAASIERDIAQFLEGLRTELMFRLSSVDLTDAKRAELQKVLSSVAKSIDATYADIAAHTDDMLRQLATSEVAMIRGVIGNAIGVDLAVGAVTKNTLATIVSDSLVMGVPLSDWWTHFAGDTKMRAMTQLRYGVASGETTPAIIRRLIGSSDAPGVLRKSRQHANSLVRTAVQSINNSAAMAVYQANTDLIKEYQQVSTFDDRTSEICIAYAGATWDTDYNPTRGTVLPFNGGCPRHWNCRSKIVPITKSWRELGIPIDEIAPSSRASMDGQVAEDMSFSEWLRSKDETVQDAMLGRGKAELWRAGKISLTELLDQRGNPLTLAQLLEKRKGRFGSKRP